MAAQNADEGKMSGADFQDVAAFPHVSQSDQDIVQEPRKSEENGIAKRKSSSIMTHKELLDHIDRVTVIASDGDTVKISHEDLQAILRNVQKKEDLGQRLKRYLVLSILFMVALAGITLVTSLLGAEMSKEVKAGEEGQLVTADGGPVMVGSSDMKVCENGALCTRGSGESTISTAASTFEIPFRKLSLLAQNETMFESLLSEVTAVEFMDDLGEMVQAKIRRTVASAVGGHTHISFYLEAASEKDETVIVVKVTQTTFRGKGRVYDTTGQALFRQTTLTEPILEAILAEQTDIAEDEFKGVGNVSLQAGVDYMKGKSYECADQMMDAFSEDVINTSLDTVAFLKLRRRHQGVCDLDCQPDLACSTSPGYCTSPAFRAQNESAQLQQLRKACESFYPTQNIKDLEDLVNARLSGQTQPNNESRRLSDYPNYGCCSTSSEFLYGGPDTANCFWGGEYRGCTSDVGCYTYLSEECCMKHDQCLDTCQREQDGDCSCRGECDHHAHWCALEAKYQCGDDHLQCTYAHYVAEVFWYTPNSCRSVASHWVSNVHRRRRSHLHRRRRMYERRRRSRRRADPRRRSSWWR